MEVILGIIMAALSAIAGICTALTELDQGQQICLQENRKRQLQKKAL